MTKFRLITYNDWWVNLEYKTFLFWKELPAIWELADFLRNNVYEWPNPNLKWCPLYLYTHTIPVSWSNDEEVCKEFIRYIEEIWDKELEKDRERNAKREQANKIKNIFYS